MAEFYGSGLVFQWVGTAGTLDMSEYQRGATFNPTGKIDVNTTGAAGYETRMVGVTDFTASYKGLWQSGTAGTAATTMENTLRFGEAGTVYMYPEGTAAGKRKYTLPCISQGPQVNTQYDALTEINIAFVGNGTALYE
jgi:hypothetical protein